MKKKIRYRTFDEIVEERFREHPEEITGFLETVLEDYEEDLDEKALLVALRHMTEANGGIEALVQKTNLSRDVLNETLYPEGRPSRSNVRKILQVFGYTLPVKPANGKD